MKLVTFNRAMAPYQPGETKLVADEIAARLQGEGALSESVDWPPAAAPTAPQGKLPLGEAKPRLTLPRRQSYQTK
jgi:hypothetical protein